MRPSEIRDHLRRRPFRPFRIYVSDESYYDVRHPEMALVGHRDVVIALEMGEDDLPDRFVFCDPIHVTRIELLDGSQPH